MNGDGYSDVIVGAIVYDNGNVDEGGAFVWLGGASAMDNKTNLSLGSNQADSYMGYSVAGAGDINGDGFGDIMIGAPHYDNGQEDEGVVFVYHGSISGIKLNSEKVLECNQIGADFGISVSGIGDVNGDGFADVVVGAELYDGGQTNEGAAFVYYGSANGILNEATRLESDVTQAWMGVSVATAGDYNKDGYVDLLIGAPSYTNGQAQEGAVFLYQGSASGVLKNSKKIIESNIVNAFFGFSGSAGDINGDSFVDLLVGAPKYMNGQSDEGAMFVYYGSASAPGLNNVPAVMEVNQAAANLGQSVSCVGDLNGDGISDVAVGAPYYSNGEDYEGVVFVYFGSVAGLNLNGKLIEKNQSQSEFGLSVAGAGDVNGDGYGELIVGMPSYFNGQGWTGAAHVYFGSMNGIEPSPKLVKNEGFQNLAFGTSVSAAGDINADGYADILVGDPSLGNGSALVCYGSTGHNLQNNLRLYNTNLTTPINQTQFAQNNFGAGLYSKSFLGGNKGKLVWETKAAGQGFSVGANNVITNSTQSSGSQNIYGSLGLLGTELKSVVPKQGPATKVRVRVKYDPTLALTGQTYGPWRYLPSYLAGNGTSPVPDEGMQETIARKAMSAEGAVSKVNVYPNPVSDRLFISEPDKSKVMNVQLVSALGRSMYKSNKAESEIDLTGFDPGIYVLIIKYADGSQSTHRIAVKN